MHFRNFESKVKNLPFFNLNDIRKFDPGFHRRQLFDWQQRGYIQPLVGGYYILANHEVDEGFLFMVANQLYPPSYISLETALAYHQVIPESVLGVTSVTSRKTRQFNSTRGQFSYRHIKPEYLFGYKVVIARPNQKFLIAGLEKALLDYLYLNSYIQDIDDFIGLRWNKASLQHIPDSPVFDQYLTMFNKNALKTRVDVLMRYLNA